MDNVPVESTDTIIVGSISDSGATLGGGDVYANPMPPNHKEDDGSSITSIFVEELSKHFPSSVPVKSSQAEDFLKAGLEVLIQRGKQRNTNGGKERNMSSIVKIFAALTGHELTEDQGWLFMTCLKLVRSQTAASFDEDSFVDGINYLALSAEAKRKT